MCFVYIECVVSGCIFIPIHHNKFIYILACLYSVYCVTHISTQLAYCANLMVMLSCIAIMKLLHQTIAVETSYLIIMCYVRRVQNNCITVCTTFHRFNDLKFDSVPNC